MHEEITDPERIAEIWGDEVVHKTDEEGKKTERGLIENPRVHFTAEFIKVDLRRPIEGAGGKISCLDLREPLGSDLKAMDAAKGESAKGMALVGSVACLTTNQMSQLRAGDITLAMEVLGCFL